jgi:hypothetical protein
MTDFKVANQYKQGMHQQNGDAETYLLKLKTNDNEVTEIKQNLS